MASAAARAGCSGPRWLPAALREHFHTCALDSAARGARDGAVSPFPPPSSWGRRQDTTVALGGRAACDHPARQGLRSSGSQARQGALPSLPIALGCAEPGCAGDLHRVSADDAPPPCGCTQHQALGGLTSGRAELASPGPASHSVPTARVCLAPSRSSSDHLPATAQGCQTCTQGLSPPCGPPAAWGQPGPRSWAALSAPFPPHRQRPPLPV